MGIPVLILGKSGSGKTASLRNMNPDEVGIFNVASKPLPFRDGNKFKVVNKAGYAAICTTLRKSPLKTFVIDDSQYLMAFDSFARAGQKGYDKFTDMAVNFYRLLEVIRDETAPDKVIYLLHHSESADDGEIKAKTIGKMLDQQLTVEGLFSIVLLAEYRDGAYIFHTKTDGKNPVKTPMGMFDSEIIDNDLNVVNKVIREYYGLEETKKKPGKRAEQQPQQTQQLQQPQQPQQPQQQVINLGGLGNEN